MKQPARTRPTADHQDTITTPEARVWVFVNSEGYKCVTNGIRVRKLHRLIWERHFGPIPPGYDIHHRSGDKLDNRLENLELLTSSEHRRRHCLALPRDKRGRWTNSYPR